MVAIRIGSIFGMGEMHDLGQIAAVGLCVGVMFAFVGSFISQAKGRPGFEGAVLGFIAGPFGWLIAVLMPTIKQPTQASASVAEAPKPAEPPKPANRRRIGTAADDAAMDFVMKLTQQDDSSGRSLHTESDPTSRRPSPSEPSQDPQA